MLPMLLSESTRFSFTNFRTSDQTAVAVCPTIVFPRSSSGVSRNSGASSPTSRISQVQETRGALSLLEDTDTNSSSDSPVKKSSLSSLLADLSRCFFELREAFRDLEFEPEFVLDLSLVFLLLDRLVEVFDLFDFLDLVEERCSCIWQNLTEVKCRGAWVLSPGIGQCSRDLH